MTSSVINATGAFVLEVYPGIVTGTNTQGVTLPRTWRVSTTVGGTTPSFTGTIGASVIV